MIDERKLIEFIKSDDFSKTINQSKDSLQNILIQLIEEQTKIGEWIPCSERIPEESLKSVIGWDEYRERCCFVQYYMNEWILGNHETVKIVAWMPLPEPYEKADWSDE